jgi:cbb3-type cytochrome oxidase maturation protein
MALGVWLVALWMAFMALVGGILFAWGWWSGQFRDVEASKHTMLKDRVPEPWPSNPERAPAPERRDVT